MHICQTISPSQILSPLFPALGLLIGHLRDPSGHLGFKSFFYVRMDFHEVKTSVTRLFFEYSRQTANPVASLSQTGDVRGTEKRNFMT